MKKIIILLCIPFFFLRCDSFLDVNPDSEVVNDDMFNSASGVEDALYGVYMTMVTKDMYGRLMSTTIPEILAQNFTSTYQYLPYLGRFEYERSETRNMYKNIWKTSYLAISYLNNIINNLESKSEKDFRHYNLYMGEALGLRAVIHFDLLRFFAVHVTSTDEAAKARAIPYVTEYDFKVTPYSSVEEIYSKVIAELKRAEAYLSEDEVLMPAERVGNEKGFTGARVLHFNLYGAQATLARVYWMKGDLDSARIYADKVIRSNKFRFASKTSLNTFMQKTVSTEETIWGLYNAEVYSDWLTQHVRRQGLGDLTTDFKSIYAYEGPTGKKDYRLDNWFGTYNRSGTPVDILVKVMGNVSDTTSLTTSYNGGPYLGTSMIRIPEMYYIMSEALLATGNAEGAMEYLDAVVDARGMEKFADRTPLVDITLSDIMAERRKEFIGEGQWWFCLKRLNSPVKLSGATGATIPGSDKIYVLPLPVEEEDYRPE